MLIVFSGLPGVGKTTLAKALAKRLRAVYLRIDTIEHAIIASDVLAADVGAAGYMAAYRIAEDNLSLNLEVVADAVNPIAATQNAWRTVARQTGSRLEEICVTCSDTNEHRRRVEARQATESEVRVPSWADVCAREFEPSATAVSIDTAHRTLEMCLEDVLTRIRQRDLIVPRFIPRQAPSLP